jgi:hypothetical protein
VRKNEGHPGLRDVVVARPFERIHRVFTLIRNDSLDGNENSRGNVEAHSHKSSGCSRAYTGPVQARAGQTETRLAFALDCDGRPAENVRKWIYKSTI